MATKVTKAVIDGQDVSEAMDNLHGTGWRDQQNADIYFSEIMGTAYDNASLASIFANYASSAQITALSNNLPLRPTPDELTNGIGGVARAPAVDDIITLMANHGAEHHGVGFSSISGAVSENAALQAALITKLDATSYHDFSNQPILDLIEEAFTTTQKNKIEALLANAPIDGKQYAQRNGSWVEITQDTTNYAPYAIFTIVAGTGIDSTTFTNISLEAGGISHPDISVLAGQIIINETGSYEIYGTIGVTGTTGNYRYGGETAISVNGATPVNGSGITSGYIRANSGHNNNGLSVHDAITLNANDTLDVMVRRTSTTSGNATTIAASRIAIRQVA